MHHFYKKRPFFIRHSPKRFERCMLIRLAGVRFSNLVPGNCQIRLFEDAQEMIHLYKAIDSI